MGYWGCPKALIKGAVAQKSQGSVIVEEGKSVHVSILERV